MSKQFLNDEEFVVLGVTKRLPDFRKSDKIFLDDYAFAQLPTVGFTGTLHVGKKTFMEDDDFRLLGLGGAWASTSCAPVGTAALSD